MNRIILIAVMGLAGAGKTSLCSWLMTQQKCLKDCNLFHICYDDYLTTTIATTTTSCYRDQRAMILNVLEELIQTIQSNSTREFQHHRCVLNSQSKDFLILCDDNFYYASMRHKLQQLGVRLNCIFGQIFVANTLDKCLENNAKRGIGCVPQKIILQMYDRLEPPSHKDKNYSLTLRPTDNTSSTIHFLTSLFDLASQCKSLTPALSPHSAPVNLVHKLDLQLRAKIKSKLDLPHLTGQTKPEISRLLNEKRKEILKEFRLQMDQLHSGDLTYYVNLLN